MSYKLIDGRYQVPLVDFGKHLQGRGWNIGEHSQFGGNMEDTQQIVITTTMKH